MQFSAAGSNIEPWPKNLIRRFCLFPKVIYTKSITNPFGFLTFSLDCGSNFPIKVGEKSENFSSGFFFCCCWLLLFLLLCRPGSKVVRVRLPAWSPIVCEKGHDLDDFLHGTAHFHSGSAAKALPVCAPLRIFQFERKTGEK